MCLTSLQGAVSGVFGRSFPHCVRVPIASGAQEWEKPPDVRSPWLGAGLGTAPAPPAPGDPGFLTRATEPAPAAAAARGAWPGASEPMRGSSFASSLLSNKMRNSFRRQFF